MGILDALSRIVNTATDMTANYVERQSSEYRSGYDRGSRNASSMSDSELRSELRRMKENGCGAGMNNAGKTRAMIDEYNNRKNHQK